MSGICEKVNTPATQDAYVYALVETTSLKLLLGQGEAVRKDLDSAIKFLIPSIRSTQLSMLPSTV